MDLDSKRTCRSFLISLAYICYFHVGIHHLKSKNFHYCLSSKEKLLLYSLYSFHDMLRLEISIAILVNHQQGIIFNIYGPCCFFAPSDVSISIMLSYSRNLLIYIPCLLASSTISLDAYAVNSIFLY